MRICLSRSASLSFRFATFISVYGNKSRIRDKKDGTLRQVAAGALASRVKPS
jgi:hypothetical protein